ncbi:MAG: hypothetical protein JNM88_04055 [Chitinophagaceae bacterium]|nr:hypothetical protein [Chitinophagaceae bacterium]
MKSILYVGATLMIGASIYGFVDYKQTKDKKEFKRMYTESPAEEPTLVDAKESVVPPADKKEIKETKKMVASNTSDGKKKTTVKTARKKKKINSDMFSRGSMEERYIEPVKAEEIKIKPDTKKTEIKEQ